MCQLTRFTCTLARYPRSEKIGSENRFGWSTMNLNSPWRTRAVAVLAFFAAFAVISPAPPPRPEPAWAHAAWMNKSLSADERADLVLKELTLDEKIDLIHGQGMPGWGKPKDNWYLGNGGAGFVLGIDRLGIPFIQMSDAAYGVRSSA